MASIINLSCITHTTSESGRGLLYKLEIFTDCLCYKVYFVFSSQRYLMAQIYGGKINAFNYIMKTRGEIIAREMCMHVVVTMHAHCDLQT